MFVSTVFMSLSELCDVKTNWRVFLNEGECSVLKTTFASVSSESLMEVEL